MHNKYNVTSAQIKEGYITTKPVILYEHNNAKSTVSPGLIMAIKLAKLAHVLSEYLSQKKIKNKKNNKIRRYMDSFDKPKSEKHTQ